MSKRVKKTTADAVHAIARAGLSAIPIVGGPAVELFQAIIQPPLERRRQEWLVSIGEKLQALESRGFDVGTLSENEEFISAVTHATQIAIRTHKEEKREALRNALFNIAVGEAPDDTLQHYFLTLVESLSPVQVRILKAFIAPDRPPHIMMGGLTQVLELNVPELRGRRDLADQLWKDLYARGLLNTDSTHITMSGQGLGERRTTGLGEQFLRFIEEPTAL